MSMNQQQMVEIDLMDLIRKIFKSWYLVLASMLIFGMGFSAVRWRRNVNNYRVAQAETQKAMESEEGLLSQLSDSDKVLVEQCQNYYKRIVETENYLSESALMQVDPYHASEVTLNFVISGPNNIHQIEEAYTAYISGSGYIDNLAEAIGWENDSSYLAELVRTVNPYLEGETDSTNVNVILPDAAEFDKDGAKTAEYENLTVKVIGRNAEETEKIAKALSQNLESYQKKVTESLGTHTITLADFSSATVIDYDLLDEININNDQLNNNQKALDNIQESLNTQQKQVWASIQKSINTKVEDETVSASSAENEQAAVQEQSDPDDAAPGLSKKDIIIGSALGLFLAVLLLALRYIFSGRIHTVGEVRKIYKEPVLGTFTKRDLWTAEKEILLATIRLACKKNDISNLILVSSLAFSGEEKKLLDQVCLELGSDIKVSYSEKVLESAEAIRKMGESGAVIYCEKLENTRKEKGFAEARLCKELGIKNIGMVIFG